MSKHNKDLRITTDNPQRGQRRAAAILLLLPVFCALSACQPTPEKPVVAGKNTNIVDQVTEMAAPQNSAALAENKQMIADQIDALGGHLSMEIKPGDQVTINVDADIIAPEYERIPMVRVRPKNLSQEQFETFMDYLTGGLPVVYSPMTDSTDEEYVSDLSKEEINWVITKLKGCIAKGGLLPQEKSEFEMEIGFKKEELANAVSKADERPYDGKLTQQYDNNAYQTITYLKCYMGDEMAATFSLWQSFSQTESQITFNNTDFSSGYNTFLPYEGTAAAGMSTTYEEARAKAEDFVKAVDGADSSLTLYESLIAYQIDNLDNYTMEISPQGYAFYFGRSYNGVPVKRVDFLRGMNENVDYSQRVSPEWFRVVMDDSGIVDAGWQNYTEYIEEVSSDVLLKDFDSILGTFEDYCRYKFAWTYQNDALASDTTPPVTLNVKSIELNTMVTPEKDNLENYITVPVWDFIADMTLEGDGMTQEGSIDEGQKDVSILTINAIDGTVIDREQGY